MSCLNYGDNTVSAAQGRTLPDAEITRAQQALNAARALVNPAAGILGVATGKSNDAAGEGAVLVFVDESMTVSVPAAVGGVRTQVIPTTAHAVAFGAAPQTASISAVPPLAAGVLNPALAVKRQLVHSLMQQNPAFFAVGVGQSLDNPREAALVVYVDRNRVPAQLLQVIGGLRTRFVVMDRLHVTRAYASQFTAGNHCMAHAVVGLNRFNRISLFCYQRGGNLQSVEAAVLNENLVGARAGHNHTGQVDARHIALQRLWVTDRQLVGPSMRTPSFSRKLKSGW